MADAVMLLLAAILWNKIAPVVAFVVAVVALLPQMQSAAGYGLLVGLKLTGLL